MVHGSAEGSRKMSSLPRETPKSGSPGHPVGLQQKAWSLAPRGEACRAGQNQYSPAAYGALCWLSGTQGAKTFLRWVFVCVAGEFEAFGPLSAGQLAGKHSLAWGGQLNAGPEGETCAPGEGHVPANCRTSPSFSAGAQNLPPQDMLDLSFPGHLIDQETWLHSPQRAQQSSCSMVHSWTGLLPVVLTLLQHRNQAGVTYLLEKVVYPLRLREGSPT